MTNGNDIVKNFGDFVLGRFGLDYHMFTSDEKRGLREVLDNLSDEMEILKFTKGDLRIWKDNETVKFDMNNGLVYHYAQVTVENGEPKWLCSMQNF